MKKRYLIPIIWGIAVVISLVLGWFSWFTAKAVPDILITVVCGGEGLVISITGIIGIVELIKGNNNGK